MLQPVTRPTALTTPRKAAESNVSVQPSVQTQAPAAPTQQSNSMIGMLENETNDKRNLVMDNAMNLISQRHKARLSIASGDKTSGNKTVDKYEQARGLLADYTRLQLIEEAKKDPSLDISKIDSLQDPDIINWLIGGDVNLQREYNNYLEKGGFVKDIYEKLMGVEEEQQEYSGIRNFAGGVINKVGQQMGGIMDMTGLTKMLQKWNAPSEEELARYDMANTDEYDKFASGQISIDQLSDPKLAGLYNQYKRDVANKEFAGSIEQYAQLSKDYFLGESQKTAQEAYKEGMPFAYNEESKGAKAGEFATEMAEFMAMPSGKNFLTNILYGTAEMLGMDAIEKASLPTQEDITDTALMNTAFESLFRAYPAARGIFRMMGKAKPEVKEALSKLTTKEIKDLGEVAKSGTKKVKAKATEIMQEAKKSITKKLDEYGTALENIRKGEGGAGKAFDDANYTMSDFFDSVNESLKGVEEKGWGKNSAPEFKIKNGELNVYNEQGIPKPSDPSGVSIVEFIKNEFEAFQHQGRKEGTRNTEEFMQLLNKKIQKLIEDGKVERDSIATFILGGVKKARENIASRMGEMGAEYLNNIKNYSNMKEYDSFFEELVGKLKPNAKTDLEKLKNTNIGQKVIKGEGDDILGEFLTLLKNNNIADKDYGADLTTLLYMFGLKDPDKLRKLIEEMYPSFPGLEELGIQYGRKKAKASMAETYGKDYKGFSIYDTIKDMIVEPAYRAKATED